jgi:hypothetical protein
MKSINKSVTKCPVCDHDLSVTRLYCVNCDTTIEGHFTTEHTPFGNLTPDQMQFLLTFVKCEGRLNRMEEEVNLSYPTLRSRLNEIVRALGYEPGKDEGPIQLTADERREILEALDQGTISWDNAQARLRGEKISESVQSSNGEKK